MMTTEQPPVSERREVEVAIDHVLEDSFPASDPPQWDSLAARARHIQPRDPSRPR